jgi:hypothetical protein
MNNNNRKIFFPPSLKKVPPPPPPPPAGKNSFGASGGGGRRTGEKERTEIATKCNKEKRGEWGMEDIGYAQDIYGVRKK